MTRFRNDATTTTVRDGTIVIGGSPLRLFRLSAEGAAVYAKISAGEPVEPSDLTDRLLAAGAIHPVVDPDDQHKFDVGDVTVVMPTHRGEPARIYALLRHCTDAAAAVFVDDGSEQPLTGVRGANVVRLRHNSGPAAARNAGLRGVQTPLVAFVDSDVELHPGWLRGLLGHFDDEHVGFVAPRVASGPAGADGDVGVARYEERHSPLDCGTAAAPIRPGSRVSYVPGAVLVARVSALREIGGFDEELRVGEDVDLVWRLVAAGWTGRYEPGVVVEHLPRPTWRKLVEQRIAYGSSAAALAARHGRAVAPLRTSPWSIAVWLLAAARRPFSALALAGGTAWALIPKLRDVPARDSLQLAARGHLYAGAALAAAVRRAWMPLVIAASLVSRTARRIAVASLLPALVQGGPARVVDDLAYGAGVWKGVLRLRDATALAPVLTDWPGRDAEQPETPPDGSTQPPRQRPA